MNTMSGSRVNSTEAAPTQSTDAQTAPRKILVWDAPVRIFHWLMALCFAGAYLTAESESWRLLHVTLGYTMAGLVGFRIVWGLAGTRYARFSSFVRGPRTVARYVGNLLRGRPEHSTGHNPAGAVAIVALLGLTAVVALSGWALYNDLAGGWLEEMHEAAANIMLAVVGIHIAGVVIASWLHKENLVRSMITGRKTGTPEQGIRSALRIVAMLMLVAVLGFWWMQWQSAPNGNLSDQPSATAKAIGHDRDDD